MNRYVDWAITTPLMLFVILMAFSYNIKNTSKVNFKHLLLVLVLNYAMLLCGYIGETNIDLHFIMNIVGFVFFVLLYAFLYFKYIKPHLGKKGQDNIALYLSYVIAWSLYGVFYYMDEYTKTLDIIF